MDIFWFLGLILAFYLITRLSTRVHDLERQLKTNIRPVQPQQAVSTAPSIAVAQSPHISAPLPQPSATTAPGSPEVTAGSVFIAWLKEDWLLKMGALLLLMGVGWFITYAFIHNWIGPAGRIAIGVALGLLVMLLGKMRLSRFVQQGEIFMVLGATTILLTLYAARSIYDFFTPALALGMMFAVAAIVAVVSVYENRNALATSSLVMALAAPLFVHAPEVNYIGLFMYIIAVVLGTMWVVALRHQRILVSLALIGTWLYSAASFVGVTHSPATEQQFLYVLACISALIFFVGSVISNSKSDRESDEFDVVSSLGVGSFVWLWGTMALPIEQQSWALVVWALVFMSGALYAYAMTKRPAPLYLYGGVSAVLIGIALALELDGAVLTIAWTLEAAILVALSLVMTKKIQTAQFASIVFAAPVLRSFLHIEWWTKASTSDAVALGVLALACMVVGYLFYHYRNHGEGAKEMSAFFSILGAVYLALALAAKLDGAMLTIAWSLEAALCALVVYAITLEKSIAQGASIAFIVPILASFGQITSPSWEVGIFHESALALVLLAVFLLAVGALLRGHDGVEDLLSKSVDGGTILMVLASIYAGVLIWLSSPTFFGAAFAVMGSLIVYTLYGLFFYMRGRMHDHAESRAYGGIVLGLVIARLLIVDVWNMELSGRIVTFLLVGALLMTTAFVGRSKEETRQIPEA